MELEDPPEDPVQRPHYIRAVAGDAVDSSSEVDPGAAEADPVLAQGQHPRVDGGGEDLLVEASIRCGSGR